MVQRIAFVGAGAVGGYVGGHLAAAGHDVVLIDAWPEHVEAIRANGLALTGVTPEESVTAHPRMMHITEVQALAKERPIDIAFVSVKSYDTEWATMLIRQYLAPGGFVVSLQNCINEERIAAIVGWGRTVGCIAARISVDLYEAGKIRRTVPKGGAAHTVFRVGEVHGRVTERVQGIADMIAAHRQREGDDQSLGRALVEALPQRHAQRHLGGDRLCRQRRRSGRRGAPLRDPGRRRGGAHRPGARLRARAYRQSRPRPPGARRRGRQVRARGDRGADARRHESRARAAICSVPRWARTC